MMVSLRVGQEVERDKMLRRLVDIQYDRNDVALRARKFRVRGDCVEVYPSMSSSGYGLNSGGRCRATLVDQSDQRRGDPTRAGTVHLSGQALRAAGERIQNAIEEIRAELEKRLEEFKRQGKLLEAQRLSARTRFDLEMMQRWAIVGD